MLCKRCKKNQATIIYKGNVNGSEVDFCYCSSCYNDLFFSLNSSANRNVFDGLIIGGIYA